MKSIKIIILVAISLICCRKQNNGHQLSHHELHPGCAHEEELAKVRDTFNLKLVVLYELDFPSDKLMFKADSLISDFKSINSDLRNDIKYLCEGQINYYKAEVLYKNGQYLESIDELYKSSVYSHITLNKAAGIAANYLKLGNHEMARTFIDSIGGNDLNDYALANYYESSKNKEKAIEQYKRMIVTDATRKHLFYKSSLIRLKELKKGNPEFIHEIVFPTGKPGAEWYSQ